MGSVESKSKRIKRVTSIVSEDGNPEKEEEIIKQNITDIKNLYSAIYLTKLKKYQEAIIKFE